MLTNQIYTYKVIRNWKTQASFSRSKDKASETVVDNVARLVELQQMLCELTVAWDSFGIVLLYGSDRTVGEVRALGALYVIECGYV